MDENYLEALRGLLADRVIQRIEFNERDPKDCERAVGEIVSIIKSRYGAEFLWKLFSKCAPTRSDEKWQRNALLLVQYLHSGLSIEKCAADMAEDNKGLPRSEQHGPLGSTSVETMKKQIKRQKDRMARDPAYRKYIESEVAKYKERFGPNDKDGDNSK